MTIGKDEALFCAGKCQQWLHRYCVSVSVKCYKAIVDDSRPYCCPCCYRDSQEERISELKCAVEAMKLEIAQLKEALSTAQAAAAKPNCEPREEDFEKSSCDWQVVGEKRSRGKRRSGRSGAGGDKRKHQHHQQTESDKTKQRWHSVKTLGVKRPEHRGAGGSHSNSNTSPGGHGATENRQVVDGVRRVWGTMRGCSYRTVLSTLQRLTSVAENVEVRRKFKKRGNTEVRWWFLIRGEETVLQNLDMEWVNIENSTSWKLERCYQPVSTSATHDLVGEGDNAHTTMHQTTSEEDGENSFLSNH